MFERLRFQKRQEEIKADLERRQQAWAILGDLWALYDFGENPNDYDTRIAVQDNLNKAEVHAFVADAMAHDLKPLGYSIQEINDIIYNEMICTYGHLALGFTHFPFPRQNLHPINIEHPLLNLGIRNLHFTRCKLSNLLWGNRQPFKTRYERLIDNLSELNNEQSPMV